MELVFEAVVVGVTVVTTTVVHVDVCPLVVIVVIQVDEVVVHLAAQMLCLHSQGHGYRPLQSESTMHPTGGGG
jgi:hypothetical protein